MIQQPSLKAVITDIHDMDNVMLGGGVSCPSCRKCC